MTDSAAGKTMAENKKHGGDLGQILRDLDAFHGDVLEYNRLLESAKGQIESTRGELKRHFEQAEEGLRLALEAAHSDMQKAGEDATESLAKSAAEAATEALFRLISERTSVADPSKIVLYARAVDGEEAEPEQLELRRLLAEDQPPPEPRPKPKRGRPVNRAENPEIRAVKRALLVERLRTAESFLRRRGKTVTVVALARRVKISKRALFKQIAKDPEIQAVVNKMRGREA